MAKLLILCHINSGKKKVLTCFEIISYEFLRFLGMLIVLNRHR